MTSEAKLSVTYPVTYAAAQPITAHWSFAIIQLNGLNVWHTQLGVWGCSVLIVLLKELQWILLMHSSQWNQWHCGLIPMLLSLDNLIWPGNWLNSHSCLATSIFFAFVWEVDISCHNPVFLHWNLCVIIDQLQVFMHLEAYWQNCVHWLNYHY